MNEQHTKIYPQQQKIKNLLQLQPLNLEQVDSVVGGCGCKSTFIRSKPHVNVGS